MDQAWECVLDWETWLFSEGSPVKLRRNDLLELRSKSRLRDSSWSVSSRFRHSVSWQVLIWFSWFLVGALATCTAVLIASELSRNCPAKIYSSNDVISSHSSVGSMATDESSWIHQRLRFTHRLCLSLCRLHPRGESPFSRLRHWDMAKIDDRYLVYVGSSGLRYALAYCHCGIYEEEEYSVQEFGDCGKSWMRVCDCFRQG